MFCTTVEVWILSLLLIIKCVPCHLYIDNDLRFEQYNIYYIMINRYDLWIIDFIQWTLPPERKKCTAVVRDDYIKYQVSLKACTLTMALLVYQEV